MNEITVQVESLQALLVSHATGGMEDEAEFMRLRQVVLSQSMLET